MSRHAAGSIVVVDSRGDALPQEPGKLRPAVVVEDHELFPDDYPKTLVVPLTRDEGLAHRVASTGYLDAVTTLVIIVPIRGPGLAEPHRS